MIYTIIWAVILVVVLSIAYQFNMVTRIRLLVTEDTPKEKETSSREQLKQSRKPKKTTNRSRKNKSSIQRTTSLSSNPATGKARQIVATRQSEVSQDRQSRARSFRAVRSVSSQQRSQRSVRGDLAQRSYTLH